MSSPSSPELAADTTRFALWDPTVPWPTFDRMPDLDVVTHVAVERAQADGYHYLHESAIAQHGDALHLCWANHKEMEYNFQDELIRGTRSVDGGLTWTPATTWIAPPQGGSLSFNHPVLASHQGRLWAFVTRWDAQQDEKPREKPLSCCNPENVGPQPSTEIFVLHEATGRWESVGRPIPRFLPFRPPMKMRDGNWIMGGEHYWYEAAVAISDGDDFSRWRTVQIPRPKELELMFPETALVDQGDRLIAICRPKGTPTAPVSVSTDCGVSWSTLECSNYPLDSSQPYAGLLSTGQHYLITCNLEERRTLISIAVTAPGGRQFVRVWKLRHQSFPRRRLFPGYMVEGKAVGNTKDSPTEWSYPAAVEHKGNLYVSYTQGKEDCVLSIIPIRALAVR